MFFVKKDVAKAANSGDAITKAALLLRNDVKKQKVCQIWPPDVENSLTIIPESVTMFLHTLLIQRWCECTNLGLKESNG